MTENQMLMGVLVAIFLCIAAGFVWSPTCTCGHRGYWHDPDTPSLGCFKCDCKEFQLR